MSRGGNYSVVGLHPSKSTRLADCGYDNYLKLRDNLDNPQIVESWNSMNTLVTDNIPLSGGAFRQLIVDLYRNDRLMKGELMIRGQRVDLSRLRANLLTVIAEGDHTTLSVGSTSGCPETKTRNSFAFRVVTSGL